MKIAVTAQAGSLDAEVDQRFGRAACFILADTDSDEWSAHDNSQNLNSMQGAGIQAAQKVSELGAQAVVTGNCGPKAFATLATAGIEVFTVASGTVKDAINTFKQGKLTKTDAANVGGHWGSV